MTVTFPLLSKLQHDKKRLKSAYQRIMRVNTFTIFPVVTILIITAEPLILGLLGEKWSGSIVFLQILTLSAYVMHLHRINLNILKVYGKGKHYLLQGVFRNGLTILGIIIAVNISIIAMAWAFVITEFLQLFINVYFSNKYINFKFKEQLKIIFPIILLAISMAFFISFISLYEFQIQILKFIVLSFSGMAYYLLMAYLFKMKVLDEIISIIGSKFNSSKKQKICKVFILKF